MTAKLDPPPVLRNGHSLQVVSVRRVSDPGPDKQDIRSLDDQGNLHDSWLKDHLECPYEVRALAGSGSGEYLERAEYLELIELVESDQYDLVLTEDLGRICRRIHAHLFCELCVDHHTRLISINDHVDTAEEGWQDRSIFSAWHHERTNRDTSGRIKRTHRSRFMQGGTASLPIFGYRKKPGAKSDDDWERVPEAEVIYKEWFNRLDNGALYAEVSDWLNESGVAPGPYCKNDHWDGRMVSRVTHNWILKGLRFRNKQKTRRISEGKYKSEQAKAEDLLTRHVPHLAFFDAAYYDRVVAKLDARNAKFCRNGKGGPDPRRNVSKKRTRFPGQSVYCSRCGRLFVFGGHGQKDHLECDGSRNYKCWNAFTVDGPLAVEKLSQVVFSQIEALEDFDPVFLEMVNEEASRLDAARETRLRDLARDVTKVQRQMDNLVDFIRAGDTSNRVRCELSRLEEEEKRLLRDKDQIERIPCDAVLVPPVEEVKQMAREAFQDLVSESFEFANRMRKLTAPIHVYPFRLCGKGQIVLRAKFRLQIANLLSDQRLRETLQRPLEHVLKVDLFNRPQHVQHRERIMELRRTMTEKEAAKELGITVTAAQRAAALDRVMKQLGLEDPYVLLTEPPSDYAKLRRHLHPRYRFSPLRGYPTDW